MMRPHKVVHAVPAPLRGALRRFADRCVPLRWQLPYVSAKLYLQGALEEELLWLPRILRGSGRIAIDVGANIGLYSYRLARLCDRVEAFEPNPAALRVLQAYRAGNIRSHCVALSSGTGTSRLRVPIVDGVPQSGLGSIEPVSSGESLAVDVGRRRLDDYRFTDVAFLKIDVEGHELEVLAGAQETLGRCLPVLQVEIEQRYQAAGIEMAFERVLALGYEGYFLFEGLQPVADFRADFHQRGYLEGRQSRKYVNNFLFFPPNYDIAPLSLAQTMTR